MFFTHHFAHRETLVRARHWLEALGYAPTDIRSPAEGEPRLTWETSPLQRDALSLVIHAAERSDPDGWPSFWQQAERERGRSRAGAPAKALFEAAPDAPRRPHRNEVGWHPTPPDASRPEVDALRERYRS